MLLKESFEERFHILAALLLHTFQGEQHPAIGVDDDEYRVGHAVGITPWTGKVDVPDPVGSS